MRRRTPTRNSDDGREELARRLSEAEGTVATLQAELKRLNEHTLAVARQFEQEAAARAEAEAISATLRTEYELLLADADALRSKVEEHQDDPSTAPRAGGQSGNPSAAS